MESHTSSACSRISNVRNAQHARSLSIISWTRCVSFGLHSSTLVVSGEANACTPALVEALIADSPSARTNTEAAQAAHRASVSWEQGFESLASWFEAGKAVEKLLQPLRTRKRRIEAILAQLLPTRRRFWGERCAWMVATLKEGGAEGDDTWRDFALVARDLVGQRSLDEIPLLHGSQQRRWKPSTPQSTSRDIETSAGWHGRGGRTWASGGVSAGPLSR